ncbi:5764_t:CDS:1 [Acaulospora morrowiae]|uniref:5764_t:CDS:1 n=1 Tax=Acaulospora morrowiae TaxID=94023 RepID=A0A9N9DDE1_9GLOM|nr:5764_t:CDS:1 [Acaulospora morrowiae]
MAIVNHNLSLFMNYDRLSELVDSRYKRGRASRKETGFRLFTEVFEDRYTSVLINQNMQRQNPNIIRKASEIRWRNMAQTERRLYNAYAENLNAENLKRKFRPSNFSAGMDLFVQTLFNGEAPKIPDDRPGLKKEINLEQYFL